METEKKKGDNLLLLAGLGILLAVILIYAPWIYVFHFTSAGFALYLITEKLSKKHPEDPAPNTPEQAVAIPRQLEDTLFIERLQNAEQLIARMMNLAPGMQRDLDTILRSREYIARMERPFIMGFPRWRLHRIDTIHELQSLRKKLDDVCVTANYVKATGDVAGLLGGTGLVAGVVYPPLAAGAAFFQIARIIGDVTVPVATLFENIISENYICEAKTVFANDARHSEPIVSVLGHSRELDKKFEDIFHCSFTESNSGEIIDSIENQVEGMRYLVDAAKLGNQIVRGDIFNEKNAILLRKIFSAFEEVKKNFKNPRDIRAFKSFAQIVLAFHGFGYVECYAQGLALLALKYLLQQFNLNLTPTMGAAVQCLNEVPNLAMHALSLRSALRIAIEGKSEYSEPMSALECQLQYELDALTRRFNELQQI